MDTQDWQEQLRGFAKPLAKVMLTVFLGMLMFELVQSLLWPDQSPWQSHAAEVIYAATLASVVGYFALRMHAVLYQQVLDENEKYRKSETELRRTKEWFRSLTEHGSDLITVIDPQGAILYDSPSIERILGYRPIDRQGKSGFDLVHPEDIPGARSIIEHAFQKLGSTHTVAMRVHGLDGRWHVLEATGKAILDHDGKLRGIINSRDITERKQIEEALRKSGHQYQLLLNSTGEGIYGVDVDGICTFVNHSAAQMFGRTREEILGKHIHELTHHTRPDGSRYPASECRMYTAYTSGQGCHSDDEVFWRRDGTSFQVQYSSFPIIENGVVLGAVAVFMDITERKQLELKARQLSRLAALGQLIGGIAHELKNPLFILTGRTQMAREKLAHQEYADLGSDLEIIGDVGHRMKTITDRFMTIAKPVTPRHEQCSIPAILHNSLESLANELTQNRIRVETAFAPDLPGIQSDPRQLYEVFLNLMQNAVQAMTHVPGERRLTVSAAREGTWIVARIHDNGPGIPARHRTRLFEPFFSTKPPEQGTGLGLWTVRSLLAELHGTVECESMEGQGATFIIRIPIVSAS